MTPSAGRDRWSLPQHARERRAPQPSGERWRPVSASLWTRRLAELESRFAALPAASPGGSRR